MFCTKPVLFLIAVCMTTHLYAESYYLDAQKGNDQNSGTKASQAWKSLDRANKVQLKPGDKLLLASGSVWQGSLKPRGSGSANEPVVIESYGPGARPRIDGTGADAVRLENFSHVVLQGLELTNRGDGSSPRRGVHIVAAETGTVAGVVVRNLFIHDVNGTSKQKDNGGIIFRTQGKQTPSRFDGLRIEHNIIWKVDRSGIAADSFHWNRKHWFPSTGVIIRDNFVADVGGDGIVPWATQNALVEHNIVQGANERGGEYNAGIWPWSADNTLFRLNRASHVKTLKDGQGFDSDYNSRGTRFEYNYSHDNEGGFMLICSPANRAPAENIGNTGTLVRRNISRNDRERIFHVSGIDDGIAEENVIYIGPGLDVQLLITSDWEGWAKSFTLRNNRYINQGRIRSGHGAKRREDGSYELAEGWGGAQNIVVENNDEHADAIKIEDWEGPQFDPAHPEGYAEFVVQHRAWMESLMRAHFGSLD